MALPQPAQKQMPVRRVGPLTIRGAVTAGLRVLGPPAPAAQVEARAAERSRKGRCSLHRSDRRAGGEIFVSGPCHKYRS
jgi:hypothetical protein